MNTTRIELRGAPEHAAALRDEIIDRGFSVVFRQSVPREKGVHPDSDEEFFEERYAHPDGNVVRYFPMIQNPDGSIETLLVEFQPEATP